MKNTRKSGNQFQGTATIKRKRLWSKGRIYESRDTMQIFLDRNLEPDEIVHHKNGDVSDNRIENLSLMSRKEHALLHNTIAKARIKAVEIHRGKPHVRRKVPPSNGLAWCFHCQEFLPKENFWKNRNRWNGLQHMCKNCNKILKRQYRMRRKNAKQKEHS